MSEDRAVSTTLNYVLGLGITFVLITGLLIAGTGFVEDQRESAMRAELQVLGQQLATDLAMADRLAATTSADNRTVTIRRNLPSRVAGKGYTVSVEGGQYPHLVLETDGADVSVQVNVTNRTDVTMTEVSGGPVQVNYTDGDEIALEEVDG